MFSPEGFRQPRGGISRYFTALHRELTSAGHSPTIFAGAHSNANLVGVPNVVGLRVRQFPGRNQLSSYAFAASAPVWRVRADLVHQTYYVPCRRRGRRPTVLTVFDLIHRKFPHLVRHAAAVVEAQEWWLRRADLVFSISESTRVDVLDWLDIPEERVVTTPLGVDIVEPTSGVNRGGRPTLLYVGGRQGYKNWDTVVRALAVAGHAGDVQLVCAGGGPMTDDERQLVKDLRMEGSVRVVPADDRQLHELYGAASALVLPSLYEGFGLPAVEAMAAGCPVIASDTSSLPEVVGDAGLLVDPASVEAWSEAIGRLLGDSTLQATLAEAGRTRAAMFSWASTAALTTEGYREVLARRDQPHRG